MKFCAFSFFLVAYLNVAYAQQTCLVSDNGSKIEQVYISLVSTSSTSDTTALTCNLIKINHPIANHFFDSLGCNACLIWFHLNDFSISTWEVPTQFTGSPLLRKAAKFKSSFDRAIIESPGFLNPQESLNDAWEKLNKLAMSDSMLDQRPVMVSEGLFVFDTSDAVVQKFGHQVKNDFDKSLHQVFEIDWNWRRAYKAYLEEELSSCGLENCTTQVRVADYSSAFSVCQGLDSTQCIERLKSSTSKWIQNQFTVVRCTNSGPILRANAHSEASASLVEFYCGGKTEPSRAKTWGGNILVTDDIAFIGRDELEYYCDDANENDIVFLGLTTSTNTVDNVTSKLKEELALGDRDIVWVGTDALKPTYREGRTGHQPIFDLDMFLAIAPPRDSQQIVLTTKLVPYSTTGRLTIAQKNMLGDLNKWLEECYDSLRVEMDKRRVNLTMINIPTPVVMVGNTITSYYPLVNGLFENVGDSSNYYMPALLRSDLQINSIIYTAKSHLGNHKINVIPIYRSMDGSSGVHCKVKVVKRQ
jgi:hypothetical protein